MYFFSNEEFFNFKNSTNVEQAYFEILNSNLDNALILFSKTDSARTRWGISFVQILQGYLSLYPTYFGIRNFLEIDLDFLLKNEKIEYVEQLLGALSILADINYEVYKYVARVMYENRYYNVVEKYLEKSKEMLYKDPELHYLYAKYYFRAKDYALSKFYINECLKILPEYVPAKIFKQVISRYLD